MCLWNFGSIYVDAEWLVDVLSKILSDISIFNRNYEILLRLMLLVMIEETCFIIVLKLRFLLKNGNMNRLIWNTKTLYTYVVQVYINIAQRYWYINELNIYLEIN